MRRLPSLLLACVLLSGAGCSSTGGDRPASYVLPYPAGTAPELLQGYNGPWGHDKKTAFAYDFRMPIGSSVTAARDGKVIRVENRFEDGNRTPGQENFIFIAHGDNTFGRYYHLTRGGALVAVGTTVRAGQPIGLSGNTGASAGPHLHFDVTKEGPEWGCQTIPIAFSNSSENPLVSGKAYEAR